MAEARELQVGLVVAASGQDGRFEVLEIKDHTARIKLLANKKDTSEEVELNYVIEVPISSLTALEGLRYWRLPRCKICGASHREAEPADIPVGIRRNSMPIRMEQSIECPNSPGKAASYKYDDWVLLTEAEYKAAQQKQKKKNYMLHITHYAGAMPGMQPEYSMTCAASVNREPSGSRQAVHFPTWEDLATLLDSVHVGEDELRTAKKSLDEHRAYTMPEVWLADYELTRLGFDAATIA